MSDSETQEQRLAGIRERAEALFDRQNPEDDLDDMFHGHEMIDFALAFADSESERHLIELNKALELSVIVPPDILAEMLTPPVCGVSKTSTSLGLAAATMGGCGKEIRDPRECSRCVDCKVPFHLDCLKNHCKSELAAERDRVLLEAAKAVCETCANDDVPIKRGNDWTHLGVMPGEYVFCSAQAIHDLRSKG